MEKGTTTVTPAMTGCGFHAKLKAAPVAGSARYVGRDEAGETSKHDARQLEAVQVGDTKTWGTKGEFHMLTRESDTMWELSRSVPGNSDMPTVVITRETAYLPGVGQTGAPLHATYAPVSPARAAMPYYMAEPGATSWSKVESRGLQDAITGAREWGPTTYDDDGRTYQVYAVRDRYDAYPADVFQRVAVGPVKAAGEAVEGMAYITTPAYVQAGACHATAAGLRDEAYSPFGTACALHAAHIPATQPAAVPPFQLPVDGSGGGGGGDDGDFNVQDLGATAGRLDTAQAVALQAMVDDPVSTVRRVMEMMARKGIPMLSQKKHGSRMLNECMDKRPLGMGATGRVFNCALPDLAEGRRVAFKHVSYVAPPWMGNLPGMTPESILSRFFGMYEEILVMLIIDEPVYYVIDEVSGWINADTANRWFPQDVSSPDYIARIAASLGRMPVVGFAMALRKGRDLGSFNSWPYTNPSRARTLLPVLRNVINQLKVIHARGLVHGDISLQNIIIGDGGKTGWLIDYGASLQVAAKGYQMAPGEADRQTTLTLAPWVAHELSAAITPKETSLDIRQYADFWSLGIIILYLVVGLDNAGAEWQIFHPASRLRKDKSCTWATLVRSPLSQTLHCKPQIIKNMPSLLRKVPDTTDVPGFNGVNMRRLVELCLFVPVLTWDGAEATFADTDPLRREIYKMFDIDHPIPSETLGATKVYPDIMPPPDAEPVLACDENLGACDDEEEEEEDDDDDDADAEDEDEAEEYYSYDDGYDDRTDESDARSNKAEGGLAPLDAAAMGTVNATTAVTQDVADAAGDTITAALDAAASIGTALLGPAAGGAAAPVTGATDAAVDLMFDAMWVDRGKEEQQLFGLTPDEEAGVGMFISQPSTQPSTASPPSTDGSAPAPGFSPTNFFRTTAITAPAPVQQNPPPGAQPPPSSSPLPDPRQLFQTTTDMMDISPMGAPRDQIFAADGAVTFWDVAGVAIPDAMQLGKRFGVPGAASTGAVITTEWGVSRTPSTPEELEQSQESVRAMMMDTTLTETAMRTLMADAGIPLVSKARNLRYLNDRGLIQGVTALGSVTMSTGRTYHNAFIHLFRTTDSLEGATEALLTAVRVHPERILGYLHPVHPQSQVADAGGFPAMIVYKDGPYSTLIHWGMEFGMPFLIESYAKSREDFVLALGIGIAKDMVTLHAHNLAAGWNFADVAVGLDLDHDIFLLDTSFSLEYTVNGIFLNSTRVPKGALFAPWAFDTHNLALLQKGDMWRLGVMLASFIDSKSELLDDKYDGDETVAGSNRTYQYLRSMREQFGEYEAMQRFFATKFFSRDSVATRIRRRVRRFLRDQVSSPQLRRLLEILLYIGPHDKTPELVSFIGLDIADVPVERMPAAAASLATVGADAVSDTVRVATNSAQTLPGDITSLVDVKLAPLLADINSPRAGNDPDAVCRVVQLTQTAGLLSAIQRTFSDNADDDDAYPGRAFKEWIQHGLASKATYIAIARNGRIIDQGGDPNVAADVYSVTKSVFGLLVADAHMKHSKAKTRNRRFNVHDRVFDMMLKQGPDGKPINDAATVIGNVTLNMLLTQTSGVDTKEVGYGDILALKRGTMLEVWAPTKVTALRTEPVDTQAPFLYNNVMTQFAEFPYAASMRRIRRDLYFTTKDEAMNTIFAFDNRIEWMTDFESSPAFQSTAVFMGIRMTGAQMLQLGIHLLATPRLFAVLEFIHAWEAQAAVTGAGYDHRDGWTYSFLWWVPPPARYGNTRWLVAIGLFGQYLVINLDTKLVAVRQHNLSTADILFAMRTENVTDSHPRFFQDVYDLLVRIGDESE